MARINKDKTKKPSKADKNRLINMFASKGFDVTTIIGDSDSPKTRQEIVEAYIEWRKANA